MSETQTSKPGEPPISDLMEEALHDATQLVRAEVSLAVEELKKEAKMAAEAAAAWAAMAVFSVIALTLGVLGVFVTAGAHLPLALFGTAGVFVGLTAAAVILARSLFPKHILERTRDRVAEDARQIKAHAS